MSDFDSRLSLRVRRLDAAVPPPASPPSVSQLPTARRRRRPVLVLLAATVALIAATSLVVTATRPPADPAQQAKDEADEERLRDDLGQYTADACLTASEAAALFQERLLALSLTDWSIRSDDRIREAPCVSGAPIGDAHEILLIPSMGGNVAKALDAVAAELMGRCLDRDEAMALIRSTLTSLGVSDPNIEVGGIRGVPLEYGDAYLQHVADGCFVYGGAQFDDAGRYTWFLSSP